MKTLLNRKSAFLFFAGWGANLTFFALFLGPLWGHALFGAAGAVVGLWLAARES